VIDRRFMAAAGFYFSAAIFTLFGIMHSPLPGGALYWPHDLGDGFNQFRPVVWEWATAYAAMGAMTWLWGWWLGNEGMINDQSE
jgi:adenine/guanine/hypoxanthine permease